MSYALVIYVELDTSDRKVAVLAAENIREGMWEMVPDLPEPEVIIMGPIHKPGKRKRKA